VSVIERREKEENNEKKKVEDWDLILKINDRMNGHYYKLVKPYYNEVSSEQVSPGVYIIRREVKKGKEGRYGPGIYLEKTILINKKMFKNINIIKGPLAWYIRQINGKVYENDNVIVIIPSDREEIEEDKFQWAIDKLETKEEYNIALHRQIDEELRLKKMRKKTSLQGNSL
jgi:hypothetical protein